LKLGLKPLRTTFVCRLHVRLVYGLALGRLTIPRPLIDYPMSGLWPRGAVEPPAVVSDRFEVTPVGRAALRPPLPLVLPLHPPRPRD
jgi:hypothetical protein